MIDLRSDVCSVPTDAMWEAMREAELGWALVGEDASVNALCERVAALLGKPAALWLPTLRDGEPGRDAHVLRAGRAASCSRPHRTCSRPSRWGSPRSRGSSRRRCGRRTGAWIRRRSRSSSPRTTRPCSILENTHTRAGGTTLSVELTAELAAAAKRHDCRVHIDGARLLNASVALGVPPADLAAPANSVVISLNKALSAPFGAVLAGSEAVVERARLMAHRLGGGSVHRAGIAAAAGLVALDTMVDRIADDHRRARELGGLLAAIPGVRLQPETVETNIVLADVSGTGLVVASS